MKDLDTYPLMCLKSASNKRNESHSTRSQDSAVKNISFDEYDSGNYINQLRDDTSHSDNRNDELSVSIEEEWVENQLKCEPKYIRTLKRPRSMALEYEVEIENKKVIMECDTGAVVSVI